MVSTCPVIQPPVLGLHNPLINCIISTIPKVRINNQISAIELRVISQAGENLGVLSKEEALHKAAEAGLDLIEIAPTAKPPVARIMSYDKFRYQKEKEGRKQRKATKAEELKQVRVSARAATHDLEVKAKKVNGFLEKGSRVEIMMLLRGREKANKDWARAKLEEFLGLLLPDHKVASPPRYTGRGFVVQVSK